MLKNAVLSIYYNELPHPQGKFFTDQKHSYYIANINENKLFRNFNGYAISKQLITAFEQAKLKKLTIIYRYPEKNTYYVTTPNNFKSKGILMSYGGHEQYVLPIKNWTAINGDFNLDPKDLDVVDVTRWAKGEPDYVFTKDGRAYISEETGQKAIGI